MGRLKNFFASIKLSAGLKPKGDFPLMEAHDIVVDEDGTRLDDKLKDVEKPNLELDTKLTEEGKAADAKAVGDRITNTVGVIETVLKKI